MSRKAKYFNQFKNWMNKHPEVVRTAFNIWPPFLFAGIRVLEIAPDYKYARLKLGWCTLTKNINGTQFGGSIFSMTDPVYVTLLFGILGHEKYYIWDSEVHINYVRPGVGPLYYEPTLTDIVIEEIREKTRGGEKYEPIMIDNVYDSKGGVVAHVERKLYIRLKREYRPR